MPRFLVQVAVTSPLLLGVILLSAVLPLRAVGGIIGWGGNGYGQATGAPNLTNVVAIATGGDHNLALQADGRL